MVDLPTAVALLDTAPVAFPAKRDVLVVTGSDAASYLQGQVSQDVEGLAVGASARTLLLQPQGKIDAWLRVHRRAEHEFWLDTDPGHGAAATERLNRFKLRVEVDIELRTVPVLSVRGPGAGTLALAGDDSPIALEATWGPVEGVDLIRVDEPIDPVAVATALDLPLGPAELADVVRVSQGLPAMGAELDQGTIPAAAGIVDRSVDFTKGCYVGQELVARVDSRGSNTPTRLHALRFRGDGIPPAGSELQLDGQDVGTVTSAVAWPGRDSIGLGYLKRSVEAPITLVAATSTGPVEVEVTELD